MPGCLEPITLSRGAIRMAQRRVIVKRLASIQNLGAMDRRLVWALSHSRRPS